MTSTFTTNISLEEPAAGDYVNTWATPVNADWSAIDKAFGGATSINVTSVSGTTVLTLTQYRNRIISFTGTLTANLIYQIPSGVGGFWYFINNATGAFTITINSGGAGTSVVLAQTYNTQVFCDGTNVRRGDTNPATISAAGSNTQVQFNSSGSLGASANLTWNGTTLVSTGFQGPLTGNVTGNVVGNLTGNVTGNVSGSSGSCTGNAATATTATNATNATTATYASLITGTTIAIGYINLPQVGKTSNYTLVLTDAAKEIYLTGTTASQTVTIPSNGSVAFPIGTFAVITNDSSQPWSIAITSDTLFFSPSGATGTRTLAAGGSATISKKTSTRWWITGTGLT